MAESTAIATRPTIVLNDEQFKRWEIISNNRAAFFRRAFNRLADPRRDINTECGYPTEYSADQYYNLYDNNSLACRVVEVMPKETWQKPPMVYEKESGKIETPFEQSWDALGRSLTGSKSWYRQEVHNPIWDYLMRLDIMSGVGQYGVLLLCYDDGQEYDQPLPGFEDPKTDTTPTNNEEPAKPATKRKLSLKALRVFPQHLAQVTAYETSKHSPRRGMPKMYQITMNDPTDVETGGIGAGTETMNVHWSRVIHNAESKRSNESFGRSRLKPVLPEVLDSRKVSGAGAEGFWKAGFPGLSIETNPQLGADVGINKPEMKSMMEDFWNGLDRGLYLEGMVAKTLAPSVGDPTPHLNGAIERICICLGIPVRIFKGSERGELASSQDDDAWNDRVAERQSKQVTANILIPFIDRNIAVGALEEPGKDGYKIEWPDITSENKSQKMDVALKKTQALVAYIGGNGQSVVPPHAFLTEWLGEDDETATTMLEEGAALEEERMNNEAALAQAEADQAAADAEANTPPGTKPQPFGGSNGAAKAKAQA